MNTMEWKTLPIGDLRPAAYNPRKKLKPGDKEYEKIKNSIMTFGYVEPVIVNYDMTVNVFPEINVCVGPMMFSKNF